MAITTEWSQNATWGYNPATDGPLGGLLVQVDYDDQAQTVGLSILNAVGDGTTKRVATSVVDLSSGQALFVVDATQWGLPYDGQRHIVAGPGATGVDTLGRALPTKTVPSSLFTRKLQGPNPTFRIDTQIG